MTTADTDGVQPPPDIVSLLEGEHLQLRERFVALESVPRDLLGQDFARLSAELVGHFSAEEREVLPVISDAAMAKERMAEHSAIEQRLQDIAQLDVDSDDFAGAVSDLHALAVKHFTEEELYLLPLLGRLPSERRVGLAEGFAATKVAAPTRPHPHAPDAPPANGLVDPLVAIVDRVRDSASGRT